MRTRSGAKIRSRVLRPDIAFAHTFVKPPWGGSNQFLLALRDEFRRRGLRVEANAISKNTRACVLNSYVFDERLVRPLIHPGCRVVHRVDGPLQTYRGWDDGTDGRVVALNDEFADATVVQSDYSLEANRSLGFVFRNPVVIHNAVDPEIFHPAPSCSVLGRRVRLIATSWSDNPNKGAKTIHWLEEHLDWGRYDLTFVGRTPIAFSRVRTIPPVGSRDLARILREHDVFVFASLHESCSNALLEALACGLPALYIDSGGNGEIVGSGGLSFRSDDELPERLEQLVHEYEDRRAAIAIPKIAEVADAYLSIMGIE